MKTLALIPARGGSKRIPHKNIKPFLGKPIIAYSIEVAKKSGLFDEIIVSTDDKKIAEVAIQYGASVPFMRSKKTSDDHTPLNDVFLEVINKYKELGKEFDYTCMILPTAPFITVENLKKGFDLLTNSTFYSVRPIVKFDFPIQRAFRLKENGEVEPMFPEFFPKRSQDLEPSYHDAGQFYWIKEDKGIIENQGGFEISSNFAQDIDTTEDWEIAEMKYLILKNKKNENQ
jgi:pseudaminic acid cytidylyltransferase